MLAIVWRRSMKPDILGPGFMTAWWLMAAEVKKGGEVQKLRDPNGVPLWSGHGYK